MLVEVYKRVKNTPSLYITINPATTAPTSPNPLTTILSPAELPLALPLELALAAEELLLFVPDVEVEVKVEVDFVTLPLLVLVEVVCPPERTVTLGEAVIVSLPVEVIVAALADGEVEVPVTIPLRSL